MTESLSRRGFVRGLALLVAAPAVIRVAQLMPIKALPIGDGVALFSMTHPVNVWKITGFDINKNAVVEFVPPEAFYECNPFDALKPFKRISRIEEIFSHV